MKKYLLLFAFLFLGFSVWAEEEIVIEMHADPTPATEPAIWQKNTKQLCRHLRASTREQLLYAMPVVSDKDRIVSNASAEYALVEYYNNAAFRKFLFQAEEPQTFITAASTVADVLAINKKYKINIGLKLKDFLSFYAEKAQEQTAAVLPAKTHLYKVLYQDINTPTPAEHWFLFEKEELTRTFETAQSKDEFLASLRPKEAPEKPKPLPPPAQKKKPRTVRKALVSGGTLHDRMYMPRVINPKTVPPTMTLIKEKQN